MAWRAPDNIVISRMELTIKHCQTTSVALEKKNYLKVAPQSFRCGKLFYTSLSIPSFPLCFAFHLLTEMFKCSKKILPNFKFIKYLQNDWLVMEPSFFLFTWVPDLLQWCHDEYDLKCSNSTWESCQKTCRLPQAPFLYC